MLKEVALLILFSQSHVSFARVKEYFVSANQSPVNILSYNKSYFYRRFRLLTLNLRKSEKHLILYRNHLSTVDPTFSIVIFSKYIYEYDEVGSAEGLK